MWDYVIYNNYYEQFVEYLFESICHCYTFKFGLDIKKYFNTSLLST